MDLIHTELVRRVSVMSHLRDARIILGVASRDVLATVGVLLLDHYLAVGPSLSRILELLL